jgi:hypothetical protein
VPVRRLLVAAIALALASPAAAASQPQPTLGAVASWAAGKAVAVHCASSTDEWQQMLTAVGHTNPLIRGYAPLGGNDVYLAPGRCAALRDGPRGGGFALGLMTLLHEAAHARGEASEAVASATRVDCWFQRLDSSTS